MRLALVIFLLSACAARADLASAVAAWSAAHPGSPFIAAHGDSIVEGYTNWLTVANCPPNGCGNPAGDIMQYIGTLTGGLVVGTNFATSGNTLEGASTSVANGQIRKIQPKYILIHAGINNISGGGTFTNATAQSILNNCVASNIVLLLDEVWPWNYTVTNGIVAWNNSSSNWVGTNSGVYSLRTHDAMQDPANPEKLLPAYTWDTQHPSILGTSNYTRLLLTKLEELEAANIINAASCSRDDVVAAIALAIDGDIVNVPAGTCNWTNSIAITKAISLMGAGTNLTYLYDWITNSTDNQAMINWTTTSNQPPARLSGFSFRGGRTSNPITGAIYWNGTQKAYRIDHCDFVGVNNHVLKTGTWALGLVDHCVFNTYFPFTFTSSTWANKTYGDGSWATPMEWGSTNMIVVEDCVSWPYNAAYSFLTDGYNGARFCVRYCSLTNMIVDQHGTESGGRFRGTRAVEHYMNTMVDTNGTLVAFDFRSGSGVLFSNSVTGFGAFSTLYAYRGSEAVPTWGGANGTNGFDTNSPTIYLTGTHNGTNGSLVLVDTTASWTVDQWKGYTAVNTTSSAGTTNSFGCVKNNTSTTMTFAPAPHTTHNNYWTNGNSYELRWVIASLDQPGMGSGNLVTGDQPAGAWPNLVIEPIYQWGNTFAGFVSTNIVTPYSFIVEGVHYTNGFAKPGYTPLVYPHPLTGISPPEVSFDAEPDTITLGNSSTLTWAVSNTTGVGLDGGSVASGGSTNVSPVVTTIYTLSATNANGVTTRQATVTVTGAAPSSGLRRFFQHLF